MTFSACPPAVCGSLLRPQWLRGSECRDAAAQLEQSIDSVPTFRSATRPSVPIKRRRATQSVLRCLLDEHPTNVATGTSKKAIGRQKGPTKEGHDTQWQQEGGLHLLILNLLIAESQGG